MFGISTFRDHPYNTTVSTFRNHFRQKTVHSMQLANRRPPLYCYCADHSQLSQAPYFMQRGRLVLCVMESESPSVIDISCGSSIKFNVPYVCWGYFIFTVGDSYVLQHSRQLRCRLHPDVRDFYRPQSRTSILWSTVQPTSAVSTLLVPHMSALPGELLTETEQ
jgi:hypothetical protein